MPLLHIKRIGSHGRLGLWDLTETSDQLLPNRLLSPSESADLLKITHEHRRREWLACRMLTRELTGRDSGIRYDEHSKPWLENSPLHISISHSRGLLGLVTDKQGTGLDLEQVKPNVRDIRQKFLSDPELREAGTGATDETLTLYWCVKEALYKYYGKKLVTFREHLRVHPFRYERTGIVEGSIVHPRMNKTLRLHYEELKSHEKLYVLACVIHED